MSRLIQRGIINKEINLNKKGIDSLVSFDYMGSAEYEFGTLNKSLTRMREKVISNTTYFTFRVKGNPKKLVSYLCPKIPDEYLQIVKEFKTDTFIKDFKVKDWSRLTYGEQQFYYRYIEDFINNLADNKVRCKECHYFDLWFKNTHLLKNDKIDFWWDIENDFMFWVTGDGSFDKKLLKTGFNIGE